MADDARRAVILGGTGAIGGATALRLATAGWRVEVTGRDASSMPPELAQAGVQFHEIDRQDAAAHDHLIADGTDLVVDVTAYRAHDIRILLPALRRVPSTVVISTRAVYVDPDGHHINGDATAAFPVPIKEDNATLPPAPKEMDPFSREGYAPCKAAVEREALDSGLPVTVLRPSKVHGRWARDPRTHHLVRAMTEEAPAIEVASGDSIDHLTAAANTAALIERVGLSPGRRILNSADPDAPSALQIVARLAELTGWQGKLVPVEVSTGRGEHPWMAPHPIVLDTRASLALGYEPVGLGLDLLEDEVTWQMAGA